MEKAKTQFNNRQFWAFLGRFCGYQTAFIMVMYVMWICGLKGQTTEKGINLFETAVSLPDRNRVEKAEAGKGSLAQAYLAPLRETYNFGNILDNDAYKDVINELDYRVPRAYAGLIISFFAAMHAWKKTKQASAQLNKNTKQQSK